MPFSEREILELRLLDHLIDLHGFLETGLPRTLAKRWALHRRQHRGGRGDHWHPKQWLRERSRPALAVAG